MNTPVTTGPADSRTRFIFDHQPVRGLHVHLQAVWQHIVQRKNYPAPIRNALGELTAAAALLSSNLKHDGTLILQVQGRGDLKMLVAEATSGHTCRATARWNEEADLSAQHSLQELLGGDGIFVITLQPDEGEQWQGLVPLEGDSIAHMLMAYMQRSEQLETHISLAASDTNLGGLLLQRLPEEGLDHDAWTHVSTLADTLSPQELLDLGAQHLLYRLFHETPPRVFPAENIEFACTCSRGKVSDMLLLLGGQEVGGIVAEQGSVGIDCDFCGEQYVFDETDVNALFGMDVVAVAKTLLPLQ